MNHTEKIQRDHFSIERTYAASINEVWDLWTTKDGIELWWGPEGFNVTVTSIDLRPGGQLVYQMTATAPPMIAFMQSQRMPLSTECRVTYLDVSPPSRLAYSTRTDFVPGVSPYDVTTVVEFQKIATGVRLVITSEVMHDDVWTERARAGYESQLRKLDALISARGN
jgi:uncharacterized protein YndB with AHSA1/START domain